MLCFSCLQYEREAALRDFSSGTVRVLIATDVASRGLDVKDVGHVINMDLPRAFEDYVHRIGECLAPYLTLRLVLVLVMSSQVC